MTDRKYNKEFYDSPPTLVVAPGAEVLHTSPGLWIRKNPNNKFAVATLYYWADPDKATGAWEEEAAAGLSNEHWEKEYLMNYTALFGAKVFPEMHEHRALIVCPPTTFEDKPGLRYWGGFDYGSRNPSSFHVYTYVDGVYYCVWEMYKPCKNLEEFANEMKDCPFWHKLDYIAADPSIFSKIVPSRHGGTTSIARLFEECGIYNLRSSINTEETFVATIRMAWANPEKIGFKIFSTCPNIISEFATAIYSSPHSQDYNQVYDERIANFNNHALDDCKYFFNSQPNPTRQKEIKWPKMWKRITK